MKSAALIVIGDEILTGKVKDENSFVFTKFMFEQGVRVEQIIVIPDDVTIIAQHVFQFSHRYDYVCTSGGIGPTHDDKTLSGVAQAFSLPIIEHEEALNYFRNAQEHAKRGSFISDVQKKMLCFPKPCRVFFTSPLWLPLVVVKNVYIFPGVPKLFETLLLGMAHLFEGGTFYREVLVTDQTEVQIAQTLQNIQEQYQDVSIGSYPQMPEKSYQVMVTVEGVEHNRVLMVATQLIPLIHARKIDDSF